VPRSGKSPGDVVVSQLLSIVAVTAAVIVVAVSFGICVYAFGSFLLMGAHTPDRELYPTLRELARETLLAAVTQPLLPLYYAVGRRMGGEPGGVPIVFVHGYMQNRVGFVGLARSLAHRGLGPMFGFNYPWFLPIEANARRLERFVARVCAETGAPAVDLVCHSMGGVVAMEMMRSEAEQDAVRVRRCVTIASPHGGVAWKGPILGIGAAAMRRGSKLLAEHAGTPIAVPCMSIYSTHDNIVHPKETSQLAARGGRDVEVEGVAHLAILFSPVVAEHVGGFLAGAGAAAT
jgi:pimeloyl-ACP methyl ester carboxylesterase